MYPIHTLATIIPELTDVEFADLKASISKYGQLVPIMLYDGQVIDGRHRQRAVKELQEDDDFTADVWAVEWTGSGDPEDWVIETNLNHRNLDAAQKAALAARQYDPKTSNGGRTSAQAEVSNNNNSIKGLAARWHCKDDNIKLAYQLREIDEHAFEQMISGTLKVGALTGLGAVRAIVFPKAPTVKGTPLPAKGRPSDDSVWVHSALEGIDFILDRFKVTPREFLGGIEQKERDRSIAIAKRMIPWLQDLLKYEKGE